MREIEVINPLLGKKLGKGKIISQFCQHPYPYEIWSKQEEFLTLDGSSWIFATFKLKQDKVKINPNQAGLNVYQLNRWFGMPLCSAVLCTCYPGDRSVRPEYIKGEVLEYEVKGGENNCSKDSVIWISLWAGDEPTSIYNQASIVYHPENGIISG